MASQLIKDNGSLKEKKSESEGEEERDEEDKKTRRKKERTRDNHPSRSRSRKDLSAERRSHRSSFRQVVPRKPSSTEEEEGDDKMEH